MKNPLPDVHGDLLLVRAPVPVTVNKAGANYKSEVAHLEYSPRRAYDEWVSILDAIAASGGDAIFDWEPEDEPLLDAGDLEVDRDGGIRPAGSGELLGRLDEVLTGRVFTANGPWAVIEGRRLRAVMPRMVPHRAAEAPYYRRLLARIGELGGYEVEIVDCPHRWEGMADVAVIGDRVALTYTVPGRYDAGLAPKTPRSSREGVAFAADIAGVPEEARIYLELVYPHFHGDTVHFAARSTRGEPALVHYPGGLFEGGAEALRAALGGARILEIGRDDAVERYAGNSRQVQSGVLVPDGVSPGFETAIANLGLAVHRVPLFELFGKAGGGPACATLYLPRDLALPTGAPLRASSRRAEIAARRERLPAKVTVAPEYFADRPRG